MQWNSASSFLCKSYKSSCGCTDFTNPLYFFVKRHIFWKIWIFKEKHLFFSQDLMNFPRKWPVALITRGRITELCLWNNLYWVCHLKCNPMFPHTDHASRSQCSISATMCSQQRIFHSLASRSLSGLSKRSVESVRIQKSIDAVYQQTTHLFTRALPSNEIICWHDRRVYCRV